MPYFNMILMRNVEVGRYLMGKHTNSNQCAHCLGSPSALFMFSVEQYTGTVELVDHA